MPSLRPTSTLLTVGLLTAALAACGSASPTASPTTTSSSSASSARPCWEAVHEAAVVTDALIDDGCVDPNGAKRVGKVTKCKNGQRLWEMDKLMGLSGEPMIPADRKDQDGISARMLYGVLCNK